MQEYLRHFGDRFEANPKLSAAQGMVAWDRCWMEYTADRLPEASKLCEEALAFGRLRIFLNTMARIRSKENRHADARKLLTEARPQMPYNEEAIARLALHAYEADKDYREPAELMILARRLDPTDRRIWKRTQWIAKGLRWQAGERSNAGDVELAQELLNLGLQLVPGDRATLTALKRFEPDDELTAAKSAVQAGPDDMKAHLALDALLYKRKRHGEIVRMWDRFLERHPDDARATSERSGALWNGGRVDEALAGAIRGCELGAQRSCAAKVRMKGLIAKHRDRSD